MKHNCIKCELEFELSSSLAPAFNGFHYKVVATIIEA